MDETQDFSKAIDQLQEVLSGDEGQNLIQTLIEKLTSSDESGSSLQTGSDTPSLPFQNLLSGNEDFDFATITKIATVMQSLNNEKNNPKVAFLQSLKPFLKEERRQRIDKAAMILKFASVLKILKQTDTGGV